MKPAVWLVATLLFVHVTIELAPAQCGIFQRLKSRIRARRDCITDVCRCQTCCPSPSEKRLVCPQFALAFHSDENGNYLYTTYFSICCPKNRRCLFDHSDPNLDLTGDCNQTDPCEPRDGQRTLGLCGRSNHIQRTLGLNGIGQFCGSTQLNPNNVSGWEVQLVDPPRLVRLPDHGTGERIVKLLWVRATQQDGASFEFGIGHEVREGTPTHEFDQVQMIHPHCFEVVVSANGIRRCFSVVTVGTPPSARAAPSSARSE